MDTKMQAIFEPVRISLESRDFTECDLLDIIGDFANMGHNYAQAAAYHARDIRTEQSETTPLSYPKLIAEVYRRVFFDAETAAKYGTDQIHKTDDAYGMLERFSAHLIDAHRMQVTQESNGAEHVPTSDLQH